MNKEGTKNYGGLIFIIIRYYLLDSISHGLEIPLPGLGSCFILQDATDDLGRESAWGIVEGADGAEDQVAEVEHLGAGSS